MYFVFAAIICLALGVTNGELSTSSDEVPVTKNDINLESRRLLYVVGTYPEWHEKIRNFKKKWGNEGEKYLSIPNVYIHGDVQEKPALPDATARRSESSLVSFENALKNITNSKNITSRRSMVENPNELASNMAWIKYLNKRNNLINEAGNEDSLKRRYSSADKIHRGNIKKKKYNVKYQINAYSDSSEEQSSSQYMGPKKNYQLHKKNENDYKYMDGDNPNKNKVNKKNLVEENTRTEKIHAPKHTAKHITRDHKKKESSEEMRPINVVIPRGKVIHGKPLSPLMGVIGNTEPNHEATSSEQELQWMKEILIPKLISRNAKLEATQKINEDKSSEGEKLKKENIYSDSDED